MLHPSETWDILCQNAAFTLRVRRSRVRIQCGS